MSVQRSYMDNICQFYFFKNDPAVSHIIDLRIPVGMNIFTYYMVKCTG